MRWAAVNVTGSAGAVFVTRKIISRADPDITGITGAASTMVNTEKGHAREK